MTHLPKFSAALLHPRYWLTRLGIGVLWLVVQLPYPVIYRLGCGIGRLAKRYEAQSVDCTTQSRALLSTHERRCARKTGGRKFRLRRHGADGNRYCWFWSDRRMARWMDVSGFEHVRNVQAQGRGILLIGVHFLTLEIGARMFGMNEPGIGVYRPNDNALIDWLQTRGRMRSNKSMIDRKDLKGMIRALKAGEVVWYAPDHDYGPRASVFAPFFAVEQAASTSGTGCWHVCRKHVSCHLFRVENLTAKAMS